MKTFNNVLKYNIFPITILLLMYIFYIMFEILPYLNMI